MALPQDGEDDDDFEEPEEEQPQVVVLKDGDLTKEEADQAQKQQMLTPTSVENLVNSGG